MTTTVGSVGSSIVVALASATGSTVEGAVVVVDDKDSFGTQVLLHSSSVKKLFFVPLHPPYTNFSQAPVSLLNAQRIKYALHSPIHLSSRQAGGGKGAAVVVDDDTSATASVAASVAAGATVVAFSSHKTTARTVKRTPKAKRVFMMCEWALEATKKAKKALSGEQYDASRDTYADEGREGNVT